MESNGDALTALAFKGQKHFKIKENTQEKTLPIFQKVTQWLDKYFSGENPEINFKLAQNGTNFQMTVWEILKSIPYGKTTTYGDISNLIATQKGIKKMSAQAVGGAIGKNPIAIIIPCHRVLGKNGELTGYAGGVLKKQKLLEIEKIL